MTGAAATQLSLIGSHEGIAASNPDRRTTEIQLRIALMNPFPALGSADIICVT